MELDGIYCLYSERINWPTDESLESKEFADLGLLFLVSDSNAEVNAPLSV